jgi:hypothetical protein
MGALQKGEKDVCTLEGGIILSQVLTWYSNTKFW